LQFHKHRQFFIGMHKETLSVVAMRVSNPCTHDKASSIVALCGHKPKLSAFVIRT
jgi:hypothetical protein